MTMTSKSNNATTQEPKKMMKNENRNGNYSLYPEPPIFPPFNPFVRHPLSVLGKIKMVIFGIVLVPIRLFGAIATLALCLLWCNICSIGNTDDVSKPYTPLRRKLLQGGCRVCSRMLLFFYGFIWINVTYEINDINERKKQLDPPIIVVNHLGFSELLYLIWSDGCCFVSKDTNRKLPFIGKIAEALQSIFVDRAPTPAETEKNNNKNKDDDSTPTLTPVRTTTDMILERAHSPPGTWPPLAVCPEGTTHTGHCLIRFATGAFRCGKPIQPVIVTSPFSPVHGYDTSFSCANIVLHILGLMTQPMNSLNVKHLAVYIPNEEEKSDPILYANNVRKKMAKELDVKCYDLTWTDKLRFEPTTKGQELGKKKLTQKYGEVPPMPIFTQDAFGNSLMMMNNNNNNDKKES